MHRSLPLIGFILMAAMLAAIRTFATTYINDPFTDGSATNTTGGDALGGVYYQGQVNSTVMTVVNDSNGIGTGNALELIPGTGEDYAKLLTFFGPATLANPRDMIQFSFNYRFASAPIDAGSGFRCGLYNSNGTRQTGDAGNATRMDDEGYGFYTDPGSALSSTVLYYEPAGDDILGGPTATGLNGFGNYGSSVSSGTTRHTVVYQIVRQTNGDLDFSVQIDSTPASTGVIPAASVMTYTFDEFSVGDGSAGVETPFLIDNLDIIKVNLPTATITAPATTGTYAAPANIVVTGTAIETGGTIASVQLYANTTSLKVSNSSSATVTWSATAAGIYSLTAVATDVDGATATSSRVNIRVTGTTDAYDNLRTRWATVLMGGTSYSTSDPTMQSVISGLASSAQGYWNSMNTSNGRTYLWSDEASTTVSSDISESYSRLLQMALAYSTNGSSLQNSSSLKTALLSAVDWMYTNRYNENIAQYDNWYDWEIASPQDLTDITALLYSVMTADEIANNMAAVNNFVPDASLTASNLAMEAQAVMVRGVIMKESANINQASGALSQVFQYVTTGDGYYSDGSFIQHTAHPYNGGYGKDCITSIANELYLLHGSFLDVTDTNVQNIYQGIYSAYQPFIYDGGMMTMQSGRDSSRSGDDEHTLGHDVIGAILRLSQIASSTNAANYQSMAKGWLQADTYNNFLTTQTVPLVALAEPVLNSGTIQAASALVGDFQFPGMDRAVHLRPGFGFGLSMSSSRVYNYESISGENLQGWFTGDGMTLLYNSDLGQFSNNFWPTVNPYRLPGTTVDTGTLANSAYQSNFKVNNWIGGTKILGLYGTDGLELDTFGSNLSAFKSWFLFDDEIVALGAGITCTSGRTIESIVENRNLESSSTNVLEINGTATPATLGWSGSYQGVNWCSLDVTGGYYFPGGANLNFLREARTGAWSNINTGQSSTSVTQNYATIWYSHGINPTNATYEYVILPNFTPSQTSAYAANPEITILENSTQAQGVTDNTLNITGVNFWNDASKTVGIITSDHKASVMVSASATTFEATVSDPTQANTGSINLTFNRPASSVISADPGITVTQLTPVIQMSVNVAGAAGKTFDAKFNSVEPVVSVGLVGSQNPCESGPTAGYFTVSRTGATNYALPVAFTMSGSAVNGVDYLAVPLQVTIPAGASSATVSIIPIADDIVEGPRPVILTLQSGTGYSVAASGSNAAQMTITDEVIDQWRLAEFGANANNESMTASPSGDGITNLMAYALNLNPNLPYSSGLPVVGSASGHLTLIYTQLDYAPDITYVVEVSSDLVNWSSGVGATTQATLSDNGTVASIKATDSTLNSSGHGRFIRLRVTRIH